MSGKFIALEGTDETLLDRIAEYLDAQLRQRDMPVVLTREPTEGPVGGQMRLAHENRLCLDDVTMAVLSVADRMDHLQRAGDGILTDLTAGKCVICANYLLAAYARRSARVTLDWLVQINQLCPWPDLVIFVERSSMQERQKYYQQAIAQCKAAGRDVVIVDGDQDVVQLLQACWTLVEPAVRV